MFISRSEEDGVLRVHDNYKIVLEMKFISDEFVCIINTDDKIEITKELDECFYEYLSRFMENRYLFNTPYSSKTPDKLVWLSDQCFNTDNPSEVNLANRLVIEKSENGFNISYQNPFFQSLGIKKASHLIAFSPDGNGHWSKNIETDLTLQTEFVIMVNNILRKKEIKEKRKEYGNK